LILDDCLACPWLAVGWVLDIYELRKPTKELIFQDGIAEIIVDMADVFIEFLI